MPTLIDSRFVYTQEDGEVVMIGFADEQLGTKEYVLLQRILKPSEEDKCLGQDNVHVIVNDQMRSGYGGVRSIKLSKDLVTIVLELATAQKLRTETKIQVSISGADVDLKGLREKTSLLCKNYVQLIDNL